MAEEELRFDPSLKKKKKRPAGDAARTAVQSQPHEEEAKPIPEAVEEDFIPDFDGKKKKKKVAAKVQQEQRMEEKILDGKAASKKPDQEADVAEESRRDSEDNKENKEVDNPWEGSDRDYTYDELCTRFFELLRQNNPEFGNRQRRFVMDVPQVCKEGTKKTVWINFSDICNCMRRKMDHVLAFVLAELGTNGSLDGSNRLVIRGRFQPKQIEKIIRRYVSEYVSCWTCNQADTVLKKDNRLSFVVCESCGSSRSVAPVKKGFEAQVGKRKKKRK